MYVFHIAYIPETDIVEAYALMESFSIMQVSSKRYATRTVIPGFPNFVHRDALVWNIYRLIGFDNNLKTTQNNIWTNSHDNQDILEFLSVLSQPSSLKHIVMREYHLNLTFEQQHRKIIKDLGYADAGNRYLTQGYSIASHSILWDVITEAWCAFW